MAFRVGLCKIQLVNNKTFCAHFLFLNLYFPFNRTQRNSACMLWMPLERQALVIRQNISPHREQVRSKSILRFFLKICVRFFQGVAFSEGNTNLSLWEAALSSSYMCNKEQNDTITGQLTLFTFNLQIQPFGVKKGVFSTGMWFFRGIVQFFLKIGLYEVLIYTRWQSAHPEFGEATRVLSNVLLLMGSAAKNIYSTFYQLKCA